MLIRLATQEDAPAILELVPRLANSFTPPPWRDPATMTATDLDVVGGAIAPPGDDLCVFVAVVEAAIAGFIHVRSVEDYYRRCKHGMSLTWWSGMAMRGRGLAGRCWTGPKNGHGPRAMTG